MSEAPAESLADLNSIAAREISPALGVDYRRVIEDFQAVSYRTPRAEFEGDQSTIMGPLELLEPGAPVCVPGCFQYIPPQIDPEGFFERHVRDMEAIIARAFAVTPEQLGGGAR